MSIPEVDPQRSLSLHIRSNPNNRSKVDKALPRGVPRMLVELAKASRPGHGAPLGLGPLRQWPSAHLRIPGSQVSG